MTLAAPARTNLFALMGFVAAFVIPPVGVVFGAIGTRQISLTREAGRGLARAAIIVGGAGTILQVAFLVVWLSLFLGILSNTRLAP